MSKLFQAVALIPDLLSWVVWGRYALVRSVRGGRRLASYPQDFVVDATNLVFTEVQTELAQVT